MVDRIAVGFLEMHSKAHDGALLDVHCFACQRHLCGDGPRDYLVMLRHTGKCCDECHLDEGGASMFITIVCGDKVKCRKPAMFNRFNEWISAFIPDSGPGDVDAVTHLRICDWCHRAQFARDTEGQRVTSEDGPKLLKCAQCGMAYYCNATCQLKAWPRHRETCSAKT